MAENLVELCCLLLYKAGTSVGFHVEDMIKDHLYFTWPFFLLCGDYQPVYSTVAQITSLRNIFFLTWKWITDYHALLYVGSQIGSVQRKQVKTEERGRPFQTGRWPWPIYPRWWQCWALPCLMHGAFLLAILVCWNTMGRAYNIHLCSSWIVSPISHCSTGNLYWLTATTLKAVDLLVPSCFSSTLVIKLVESGIHQ